MRELLENLLAVSTRGGGCNTSGGGSGGGGGGGSSGGGSSSGGGGGGGSTTTLSRQHYHRMVELFSLVPIGLPPIANIVRKHITDAGLALIKKQSANAEGDLLAYVQELLDLDGVYSEIIGSTPGEGYFNGDATFLKAAREAFEEFVNKGIGKSATAELLSNFCDNLLKRSGERLSDEALEDKLEKVVRLFGYLFDKVIFSQFYRRQLLLAPSVGASAERSMIAKLKLRGGAQFTHDMEGMMTDMRLSQDIQSAFAEHVKDKELEPGTDLTVQVLTTKFWPQYKSDELNLQKEMLQFVEAIKAFYDLHTSHRRLRWCTRWARRPWWASSRPRGRARSTTCSSPPTRPASCCSSTRRTR